MNKHCASVAAVVVTFNPDAGFVSRTKAFLEQVSEVIIVDNSSNKSSRRFITEAAFDHRVLLLENHANLGVAAALNRGVKLASDRGNEWVLTLDQDSTPCSGMVRAQLDVMVTHKGSEGIVAIVPDIVDINARKGSPLWISKKGGLPVTFVRNPCSGNEVLEVDVAITSGALMNVASYNLLGPFIEDLFIDYVDTEYCLRARKSGFRILVACAAKLNHHLGEPAEVRRFGLSRKLPHHAALRYYYMSRNRVLMYKWYGFSFPHWLVFDFMSFIYNWLNTLAFGTERLMKVKYFFRGLKDGLRGRLGSYESHYKE